MTLNIWTDGVESSGKPVLFYIHGGGFTGGSGADFPGEVYAREGIVTVSVNYRVGAMGFLYLGGLLGEGYQGSGNNGIADLVAALGWVQRNIAAFGGNPGQVTIMGQSAGAKCVSTLLTVPTAQGLFHGAVAQSGATQAVRDAGTASAVADRLLKALGLGKEEAGKLLELPAEVIMKAQDNSIHTFGPVVDGLLIPLAPLEAVSAGSVSRVPLLLGTNKDEAASFVASSPDMKEPNERIIATLFGQNGGYVRRTYEELAGRTGGWTETLTRCLYQIAAIRLAEAWSSQDLPVWLYSFEFASAIGAYHGLESEFLADYGKQPADQALVIPSDGRPLIHSMHGYWVDFIKTGKLPADWPRFELNGRQRMVLDRIPRLDQAPCWQTDDFSHQVLVL